MDKDLLVTAGQKLVTALDAGPVKPKVAMWVHNPDTDTWKLWIVPAAKNTDQNEFYRLVSEAISKHRDDLGGLDISSVTLVKDTHPAITGMKGFIHMPGLGSAFVSNNRVNGFFVPDGIILRMDL